jgi:hypothetical protein
LIIRGVMGYINHVFWYDAGLMRRQNESYLELERTSEIPSLLATLLILYTWHTDKYCWS